MARKTTSRAKMPKFKMGPVHVRAARGPNDGQYYWRWVVYRDGDEHGGALGWATYDHAQKLVAAKVAAGEIVTEKRPTIGVLPTTVADLMECWMFSENARPDLKPKTKTTTKHYADKIAIGLRHVRLTEMCFARLEAYKNARLAEGAATNSVNHEISIMRRAWAWGVHRGYCPDRPLPRPAVKVRPKRPKATPTIADVEAILKHMDPARWPFVAVLLITETGMRIGEMADLRWRDVDFRRCVVTVPETGKTGTREVTISPATADLLKRRRKGAPDDRYVLGVHAGTVRTSLSQRYLPLACRAAGLPTFMPHGLRRLTVNELYDNGIDPTVAASMLGHAPQTAARYYRRASIEKKRNAATVAGLLGFASNVIVLPDRTPPDPLAGPDVAAPVGLSST